MQKIQMVDLQAQYKQLQIEIDKNIKEVLTTGAYINGPLVKQFCADLGTFLSTKFVIPCANGTDALQLALMALNLEKGSEVITTAFTFVATAEVLVLLGLKPVFVDINLDTFNIDPSKIEAAITEKTKVILPVHLYGQCADMNEINAIAKKHNLFIVEDNAQSIGATQNGKLTGNFGDISCISFYPSKNLGAYGDAGVVCTNNENLAKKIICFANHGQTERYTYGEIGINSRLDSLQAAVLAAKLPQLCAFNKNRNDAATFYSEHLQNIDDLELPITKAGNFHVFHQYTMKVKNGKRAELQNYLKEKEIPSMIYYPKGLHLQDAYKAYKTVLPNTEKASEAVLSLPMHPNLQEDQLLYICDSIKEFFT